MLIFFNDSTLRHWCRENDVAAPETPLEPTLSSLADYVELNDKVAAPAAKALYEKLRKGRLTVTETETYRTLADFGEAITYLNEVAAFAASTGQAEVLTEALHKLHVYAGEDKTRCWMYKDFAPYSYAFNMHRWDEDKHDWVFWFNGGFIYHGPHDNGGDGSAPTFAVNLSSTYGWSVHT